MSLTVKFNEDGSRIIAIRGVPIPDGILSCEPRSFSPPNRDVSEDAFRTVKLAFQWMKPAPTSGEP